MGILAARSRPDLDSGIALYQDCLGHKLLWRRETQAVLLESHCTSILEPFIIAVCWCAMAKPVTPLVGCDVFVLNQKSEVLLIQRADNGRWALPGGCHDLGETAQLCAERECREESGYEVKVTDLLA